jgi:hypothetical protein
LKIPFPCSHFPKHPVGKPRPFFDIASNSKFRA